ncbi:hypothetical protein E2C01_041794 [Portunus trituberculatus]|uniref:Ig-like domain-containing protein n=1 Tax=Portunus trituberculatus TaxID=210409 RepID=A0A5B7FRY2_PORTR|nr:hypothetical protein [Portunus trituberculatus]
MTNFLILFTLTVSCVGQAKIASEEEKIEKDFQKMLREQERSVLVEVQTARLGDNSSLGVEEQLKYWKLYTEYEDCLKRRTYLPLHDVPRRAVAVPEEKRELKLPCLGYCLNPFHQRGAKWVYFRSGEFMARSESVVLEATQHLITLEGDLIIGNVAMKDAGLYWCHEERHVAVVWLVEVIPKKQLTRISGLTPPPNTKRRYEQFGLLAEIQWTPWSPCSRCHHAGTTMRLGTCVLKVTGKWPRDLKETLTNPLRMLVVYHETGVPCRSAYMAAVVEELPDIKTLIDYIQVGNCRLPCSSREFVFFRQKNEPRYSKLPLSKALKGEVAMQQFKPPDKFVEKMWLPGNDLYLTCPGVESRDAVTWTKGHVPLETIVRIKSQFENRFAILDNGQVVVRRPERRDMGLYVCYKAGQQEPAAAVRVKVKEVGRVVKGDTAQFIRDVLIMIPVVVVLVGLVLVACCTGQHHEEQGYI